MNDLNVRSGALSTSLNSATGTLCFEKADAGCFVLGVAGVLPCVSEHFGEGYFHVLFSRYQTEIPVEKRNY